MVSEAHCSYLDKSVLERSQGKGAQSTRELNQEREFDGTL